MVDKRGLGVKYKANRKSLSNLKKWETKPFIRRYVTKQYFNHNGVFEIKVLFIYPKGRVVKSMLVTGVSDINLMGEGNIKSQIINAYLNALIRFFAKAQTKTGTPFTAQIQDYNCLYFNTRYEYRQVLQKGKRYVYVYRDKQLSARHKARIISKHRVLIALREWNNINTPNGQIK